MNRTRDHWKVKYLEKSVLEFVDIGQHGKTDDHYFEGDNLDILLGHPPVCSLCCSSVPFVL